MKLWEHFLFGLFIAICFAFGAVIGVSFIEKDKPPVWQIAAEDEPEVAEATRAECVPCNGEGHTCGKMCQYCKGYGTVPIRRLTLYPDKTDSENEPDCQVKILSSLRK